MSFNTKIIEFYGLPKTGKTTSANALLKHIKYDLGKKTKIIIERAGICPIKDKLHPSFNYWTVVSFLKEYIEANDAGYDFIIADRGILDAYIWINFLSKQVNDFDYKSSFQELIPQFILDNYLLSFYFKSSNTTIIEREYSRLINKGNGRKSRIMNHNVLDKYAHSYDEMKPFLNEICVTKVVDTDKTTDKDITAMVNNVAEEFLKHSGI